MNAEQFLIIEDDTTLNQGLCKALQSPGRQLVSCETIGEAKEQLALGMTSLVILDINLPDGNGLSLLKDIRNSFPDLPVILLTANDTDQDIVEGLNQGADDYITKPFSLQVLKARVNTQIRKRWRQNNKDEIFADGAYRFDFPRMEFSVEGSPIELSKTEQKTLKILTDHADGTVNRDTIIDYVWTDGSLYVDENALSVTIKRLRDKLSCKDKIKTIYGIGYSWVTENE